MISHYWVILLLKFIIITKSESLAAVSGYETIKRQMILNKTLICQALSHKIHSEIRSDEEKITRVVQIFYLSAQWLRAPDRFTSYVAQVYGVSEYMTHEVVMCHALFLGEKVKGQGHTGRSCMLCWPLVAKQLMGAAAIRSIPW